ncbi:MAG: hypothetical protein M0Z41_12740 [Peptococcaceae bacterium]|jgi:hypothetical protein|nr:hypothetical protein [Peptococcaceae bacterium]
MQLKDWFFTDAFVNFYSVACLELGATIRFLPAHPPLCPPCRRGCLNAGQDIPVFLDPRWTSRQAQQYATRAIFHHLIALEGFPAVRPRNKEDLARKLCYRFNWRVLGLVVNQKMDQFFPAEQPDLLLTDLFVNTVKYMNVCHERVHDHLELSLPVLDIFYQYFSLRPRQQRQLAGTVKHKWTQVHRLLGHMVDLSENFSVMQPPECAKMLKGMMSLLGAGDAVEVYYRDEDVPAGCYVKDRPADRQVCRPVP